MVIFVRGIIIMPNARSRAISCGTACSNSCTSSFSALAAARHASTPPSLAPAGDRCVAGLSLLVLLALALEGLLH